MAKATVLNEVTYAVSFKQSVNLSQIECLCYIRQHQDIRCIR